MGVTALREHQHGGRGRPLEIAVQHVPDLGALAPVIHPANHHDPPFGEHRWGFDQRVQRLAVEIGGRADVQIEVARGRVQDRLSDRVHQLVLEDLLAAREIVHGRRPAPLQRPVCLLKREIAHHRRKLPAAGSR
jgi:hypothetical protein